MSKINFELDIANWFSKNNTEDKSINTMAFDYYKYKGINKNTTVDQWLFGLESNSYPPYVQLIRIIKKLKKKEYNDNRRTGREVKKWSLK